MFGAKTAGDAREKYLPAWQRDVSEVVGSGSSNPFARALGAGVVQHSLPCLPLPFEGGSDNDTLMHETAVPQQFHP